MAGAWVERPGRVVNINRAIVGVFFLKEFMQLK